MDAQGPHEEPPAPTQAPAGTADAPELPEAPAPPRRSGRMLLIALAIAGAVVVAIAVVAAMRSGDDAGERQAASPSAGGAIDGAELPPSIGGAPLLEGEIADAMSGLMDAYAKGAGTEFDTGIYGSGQRPVYMYIRYHTDIPPGDPEAFLRYSMSAAGYDLKGDPVTVHGGSGASVTCSAADAPGLHAVCVVAENNILDGMLMSFDADPRAAADAMLAAIEA